MFVAGGFLWLNLIYDSQRMVVDYSYTRGELVTSFRNVKAYGWPLSTFKPIRDEEHYLGRGHWAPPLQGYNIENAYLYADGAFALLILFLIALTLEWRIRHSTK